MSGAIEDHSEPAGDPHFNDEPDGPTNGNPMYSRIGIARWRGRLANLLVDPHPENAYAYNAFFEEMESFDMGEQDFHGYRLIKQLSLLARHPRPAILDLPFNLPQRAAALVEKWSALPVSHESGASHAHGTTVVVQGNSSSGENSPQVEPDSPLTTVLHPIHAPELPPELLTLMMRLYSPPLGQFVKQNWLEWVIGRSDEWRQWRDQRHLLLSCSLVCKRWGRVAKGMLYSGDICIYHPKSARLLVRTLIDDPETANCVQYLFLINFERIGSLEQASFIVNASRLVALCPKLKTLHAQLEALSFPLPPHSAISIPSSREIELPIFDSLFEIRISNQTFLLLAPLFSRTPNLRSLDVIYFAPCSSREENIDIDSLDTINKLARIPQPTFRLRHLSLSQCRLSPAHWRWLLSSTALCNTPNLSLELQEMGGVTRTIAEILGPCVGELHLRGALDSPQLGDAQMSQCIALFPALTALWISGRDWPWDDIWAGLAQGAGANTGIDTGDNARGLKVVAITYSRQGVEGLVRAVQSRESIPGRSTTTPWCPHLECIFVHHLADTDQFYAVTEREIAESWAMLQQACADRDLPIDWFTDSGNNGHGSWFEGPREDDLL